MSVLRLFDIEPLDAPSVGAPERGGASDVMGLDDEQFHASERYLAEHLERYGDIAVVQAVLWLCDRGHRAPSDNLEDLHVEVRRFPRTAAAVTAVRDALTRDENDRPQGFWPRFLLARFSK